MKSTFIKTDSRVRLVLSPDSEEERAMFLKLEGSIVIVVKDNLRVFDDNVSGGLLLDESQKVTTKEESQIT